MEIIDWKRWNVINGGKQSYRHQRLMLRIRWRLGRKSCPVLALNENLSCFGPGAFIFRKRSIPELSLCCTANKIHHFSIFNLNNRSGNIKIHSRQLFNSIFFMFYVCFRWIFSIKDTKSLVPIWWSNISHVHCSITFNCG